MYLYGKISILVLALSQVCYVQASNSTKVDRDLKDFDNRVVTIKAEFNKIAAAPLDKGWVKKKLKHMVEIDQYMRNFWNIPIGHKYSEIEKNEFQELFSTRNSIIDAENTSELKKLLRTYKWFTISSFGKEADKDAWLLVQHADQDIAFQREVLQILSELYLKKETDPSNYAYLYDRVASSPNDASQRKLQKYGTQGSCIGPEQWKPFPVEDPRHLDERRRSVGLESKAEYISRFKTICR